jgi:hypothetical protein
MTEEHKEQDPAYREPQNFSLGNNKVHTWYISIICNDMET